MAELRLNGHSAAGSVPTSFTYETKGKRLGVGEMTNWLIAGSMGRRVI